MFIKLNSLKEGEVRINSNRIVKYRQFSEGTLLFLTDNYREEVKETVEEVDKLLAFCDNRIEISSDCEVKLECLSIARRF